MYIGVDSEVRITYHRPAVRGRNVWNDESMFNQIGKLVPRNGNPRPWRAGANEATTITFEDDVTIEGKRLPAGTYGLFVIPREREWTVIFNRDYKLWGSFDYNERNDALRVQVSPVTDRHEEWLSYGFEDIKIDSCTAFLHWEQKRFHSESSLQTETQSD